MLVLTIYMSCLLLIDFFEYASFNEGSTVWKDNVTLPAITLCSANYVNYTALKMALSGENVNHTLLEDFNGFMRTTSQFNRKGNFINAIDIAAAVRIIGWEDDEGSINTKFKNDMLSMLIGTDKDFSFESIDQQIKFPEKVLYTTALGECLELNDNGAMVQSNSGQNGGLTIDVDANVQDYLFSSQTLGFVVFIR